jgi:hypothetical protein
VGEVFRAVTLITYGWEAIFWGGVKMGPTRGDMMAAYGGGGGGLYWGDMVGGHDGEAKRRHDLIL